VTRRLVILGAMLWTLIVTFSRAVRLPNDFAKEHWLIDYRFGFVKRGLVGTVMALATKAVHARETERLIDVVASVQSVVFCLVMLWLGLRVVRRSQWLSPVAVTVLAFLSSPFIVMSAHLVGYYDNIIIVLTVLSLALLFNGWIRAAAVLQAIAILVHENALLVGVPVFSWACWLAQPRRPQTPRMRWSLWPALLPVAVFVMLVASQSLGLHGVEQSLTTYLSSYPFIAKHIEAVRVPHWITITFYDSYVLHQGQFLSRVLSQQMIGLVLPSMVAILGVVFEVGDIGAVSVESLIVLSICLAPQLMHVMAWDTARIWTYSIVCAFLLMWTYIEVRGVRTLPSQFVTLLCIVALFLNGIETTPLMDGLRDHFAVTTRLLLYTPVVAVASGLAWIDRGHIEASVDEVVVLPNVAVNGSSPVVASVNETENGFGGTEGPI